MQAAATIVRRLVSTRSSRGARCITSVVQDPGIPDFDVKNEPLLGYLAGSQELQQLEAALQKHGSAVADVPIVIGDEEIRTDLVRYQPRPHDHKNPVAKFYHATPEVVQKAIDNSLSVRETWEKVPLAEKIAIFHRAADLMATKYRMDLNATTMLGQSKTIIQAEIDAAAELVDFLRFNAFFAKELCKWQPISEDRSVTKNSMRMRGLEGFVAAVSPFNFTAIGGNLASAPALMGNVVVWKPSDTAVLSNYTAYRILREAGMPPGVINFVPADGPVYGDTVTASPHLAVVNFTGSVPTFQHLWKQVGNNIASYHSFPRLVGECGGKNYHFIHPSADAATVAPATMRSAFEFGGQKCSACSRMYVPRSRWDEIRSRMLDIHKEIRVGDPLKKETFYGAVIDEKAFKRIQSYIEHAKSSPNLEVIAGGGCDSSVGYFVEPTIVVSRDPDERILQEEIFGPVLSVFVYEDGQEAATLEMIGRCPYALTGAVFSQDQAFAEFALEKMKMTCGNFYINDKSTGSVVGQQPFGGGRISGTNDKAGGPHYMLKYCSPQAVKETFVPLTEWKYPYME
ncbi:delta-1-pyrroline-5-carboxylate dehydrogenase, mitochondrial-like [Pollicipes pollicipes]|uniref:delta-1-pyrroline-5-carboxylate dehydrogenase, mitochondrial-like n=1 Tax=Pollicipes pollicipes TaxID=41117 RepID=UPI0018850625|nr:delta-1-pyrroline-5-carboxylate dehydrogenase, mitochondrial-like [Pollicipes pollicipes]